MYPTIRSGKQDTKKDNPSLASNRKTRFRAIKGEQSMMGNYASADSIYEIQ